MKLLFTSLFLLAFSLLTFAQVPQSFSYQAIARDASGNGIANQNIGLRISILQGSITGTAVYTETHVAQTDANGILNLAIGAGTPAAGTFAAIDWSTGTYFVKVEMDITGGTNYVLMGTSQLLSVPYALYAGGVKLTKNNEPLDFYVGEDGAVYTLKKIAVEKPYNAAPTVSDVEGNVYGTVKIGTQVWMSENLRTKKYNDGTSIPNVTSDIDWSNLTSPARCSYKNTTNADTIKLFGLIYNGYAVQTNKLCPAGWHVPTTAEFETFMAYLGPLGAYRLKSDQHWDTNFNTINDAGFDAYQVGSRSYYSPSNFFIDGPNWWSATTTSDPGNMKTLTLVGNAVPLSSCLFISNFSSNFGASVRCIKN